MLDIVTYLYATIFKEQLEIVPFKLSWNDRHCSDTQ
jgi:hypothetical protein